MYPDRLSALASASHNAGARTETHNLGGIHADAHHATLHATLTLDRYVPESLSPEVWVEILSRNRSI